MIFAGPSAQEVRRPQLQVPLLPRAYLCLQPWWPVGTQACTGSVEGSRQVSGASGVLSRVENVTVSVTVIRDAWGSQRQSFSCFVKNELVLTLPMLLSLSPRAVG